MERLDLTQSRPSDFPIAAAQPNPVPADLISMKRPLAISPYRPKAAIKEVAPKQTVKFPKSMLLDCRCSRRGTHDFLHSNVPRMIKSKTVFIVGAGASAEVGLPVGGQLKKVISDKLNISSVRLKSE